MSAARQADGTDIVMLVPIAALAVAGGIALVVAVLTDPGGEAPEFDDLDDGHGPRSVR